MNNACTACQSTRICLKATTEYITATVCKECIRSCPLCSGRGFHVTERNGYEYVSDCTCKENERKASLFSSAQIPSLYLDKLHVAIKTSATYKASKNQQEAQSQVLSWARSYSKGDAGFILEGSFGTGKTMMLCQALTILTTTLKVSCLYIDFSLLLQEIKQKISNKENMSELYRKLKDVTVLAIDELGKVRGTEWELSELDMLISYRYQSSATTLFATNFSDQELTARIGGKLSSRIAERCKPLSVSGEDFRRQQPRHL